MILIPAKDHILESSYVLPPAFAFPGQIIQMLQMFSYPVFCNESPLKGHRFMRKELMKNLF